MGRSTSAFLWRLFERGGSTLVSVVVQVVMARLLAPEEYGQLAIMMVFVNVGGVIVGSGLSTALVQAERVDSGSYSTVFWMSLAVSLVLYAALFLAAPTIAAAYSAPGLTWPLRAVGLLLVINSYSGVQNAEVTRTLQMRKTFAATLAAGVASGIVGVASALAGAGLWALVAQQLTHALVSRAVLARLVEWRPTREFRPDEARALFGFGWKLLASGLLDTGYQSLSDLVVGLGFSTSDLGIMNQGKRYPSVAVGAIDGAIQPVVLSRVSRMAGDVAAARAWTRRALRASCYFVAPCMALLACVAPSLVPLLVGERWMLSVPYLQVFCATYALWPVHTTNLNALNAMGRSDLFLKLEIIKKAYGVANLLFCAFVLRDVWLLCCSYLLTGVVSSLVNAWPNRRVLGYGYLDQVRDVAPGFGLSLAAAAAALGAGALPLPAVPLMLAQTAAFAAVYLGLSKAFKVEELEWGVGVARGLLRRKHGEEEQQQQ